MQKINMKGSAMLFSLWSLSLLSLIRVASASPAPPALSLVSNNASQKAVNLPELFPVPDSNMALSFWAIGEAVEPWTLQSILMVSMAFLREQISSQGRGAHPLKGAFRYDLGDDMEIAIGKMPDDPDGLDWSQLQTVVSGLWEYIVTGMRYRTVYFDILNVEDDAQIAWGQLVKWGTGSSSDRTAKRGVQLSALTLPSSGDLDSGRHNSSLSAPLGRPIFWPVKNTDMTLRFSTFGSDPQDIDEQAVRDLFIDLVMVVNNGIARYGVETLLNNEAFHYGRPVALEVVNWRHMLTWGHLASVILGLVDFMVDHDHFRSWYFAIFVGDPKVEIALGIITKDDLVFHNNKNVTVVARRRNSKNGIGAG